MENSPFFECFQLRTSARIVSMRALNRDHSLKMMVDDILVKISITVIFSNREIFVPFENDFIYHVSLFLYSFVL